MTVFELRSSKSDPAEKSPKTIVDLVDALDHQVQYAKGIADAIRGTEAFIGDPCCMDGATALIAEHIEKLSGIATDTQLIAEWRIINAEISNSHAWEISNLLRGQFLLLEAQRAYWNITG